MISQSTVELEQPVNPDDQENEPAPKAQILRETILQFLDKEQEAVSKKTRAKPGWFLLARRTGENANLFTTEGGYGDFDEGMVEEVLNSFGIDQTKDVEHQNTTQELQWQKLNSTDPNVDIRAMKGQVLDPTTNKYHYVESYRFGVKSNN